MSSVAPSYYTGTSHGTPHVSRRNVLPLADLIRRRQWVAWRLEKRRGDDPDAKPTKVPYSPVSDRMASSTDPSTWGSYDEARAVVDAGRADGVGYVFMAADPFFGIDLDGCRDPRTGEVAAWALEIVERFDTYTEPSPSGKGLHLIGRGEKPAPNSRKGGQIECYDRARFFTMTLDPLPGYEQLQDRSDVLTTWHRETWPQEPRERAGGSVTLTLEDRDIIDRLSVQPGKAPALVRGDAREYPSPSEARAALAWLCCFYTDDEAQVSRIVQASGLFRDGTSERERERKARQDAKAAMESYTGPRYDPERYRRQSDRLLAPRPAPADPELDTRSLEELKALVRQQTAIIEVEHAARIAAEQRADRLALERSHIMSILRNGELQTGERLTGFAVALDLHARIANGEAPRDHGYRAYARRYAEMTGQSEGTAARHLRSLSDKGLVPKRVVREQTEYEDPDLETGEIVTARGLRDVNYIEVPDGKVISIIDRLATYQRPDDESRHGGKREPRPACKHHPDAGTYTVRREHIECAQCHVVLEEAEPKRTYHPPVDVDELEEDESSDSNLIPEHLSAAPVGIESLSDIKLMPEPGPAADRSDSIMQPEPRRGIFSYVNNAPERTTRREGQCIESGCTNPLAPGAKYYCEQHGGAPVAADHAVHPAGVDHGAVNPVAVESWIRSQLKDGPLPAPEIIARAQAHGIDPGFLEEVRAHHGIQVATIDGVTCWKTADGRKAVA